MPSRIEDYALIGDGRAAALVARDGSIDWLCLPRFDSGACFAALLGSPEHGRWRVAPAGEARSVRRKYRDGTLVLETEFTTDDGVAALIDFMPIGTDSPALVRVVEGRRGRVPMRMELVVRYDYGSIVPGVREAEHSVSAVAGPDAVEVRATVAIRGEGPGTVAEFAVAAGQRERFVLAWHPSHQPPPAPINADRALGETEAWWRDWSGRCKPAGPWHEAVVRSLITLKGLTYAPTGAIVAAPTTSLPERIGGVRNWDYRYCWIRDASLTLASLLRAGHVDEARDWWSWFLRAVAGRPEQMRIMYGIGGERRLAEFELPWLPGYEGSAPVRVGNAAHAQFQLDVYGELADAMDRSDLAGLAPTPDAWAAARTLFDFVEAHWREPDEGIWEVRGPRRDFTHSKMMAWVAIDRAVRIAERSGLEGPVDRWRTLRDAIHEDVCRRGFDPVLGSFVQSYGSDQLDASLLLMPLVGFLPPGDPRVMGTVAAIERDLTADGFVARYPSVEGADGLPPGEGAFLPCTFWLVDNLALQGRRDEAVRLFERLLALRNDVGLLSEEYDPGSRRLVGNFPQAFSHLCLVDSAYQLAGIAEP